MVAVEDNKPNNDVQNEVKHNSPTQTEVHHWIFEENDGIWFDYLTKIKKKLNAAVTVRHQCC